MKKIIIVLIVLQSLAAASLYAQTKPSFYKLNKEADAPLAETPSGNSINDIIAVGNEVWVSGSKGANKSADRGANWINYSGYPEFQGLNSAAIAKTGDTVCIALARSVEQSGSYLPEGQGIRYSTDNGATWKVSAQSLDANDDNKIVYGINTLDALPITTAINNITYDAVLISGYIYTANFAGGLRRSRDGGETWERVVIPPDYLNSINESDTLNFDLSPSAGALGLEGNLNHRVFSIAGEGDSTLYVGTAGGINKTTDLGKSWVKFNHTNQEQSISGNFVTALAYNPFDGSIWAATWKAEGEDEFYGVSFSLDGGATWRTTLEGERAHNFGFKETQVLIPTDNGVYRSTDYGSTWVLPGNIVDDSTKINLTTNVFYAAASSGDDVWLGSDKGLARITEIQSIPWEGAWKIFIASSKLTSKSETYAFPNPFSPDDETISIKYSTGGKREKVTIRVFDFGMNLVRTIIQNAERGDNIHTVDGFNDSPNAGVIDYWDGRDERGNIVANGVYFYRVDVGGEEPIFGKIIVLM